MGEQKKYWIGFNMMPGIGPVKVRRLLESFGDLETAWNASPIDLQSAGLGPKGSRDFSSFRSEVNLDKEWMRIERAEVEVITWESEKYPERLREIEYAPPVLYVRGDISAAERPCVAVVGTRQPTSYGKGVAHELCTHLARHRVTVVSGLARGIDGVSQHASLEAGGRTIGVLGSGVDQVYPPEHRNLYERIRGQGAILTDYPMGTRPEPRNFPPRNRIISGMALLVVIVEAGKSSGALITANFAADQGRDVMAVPGDVRSNASRGANELLKEGAAPMTQVEDVLEALGIEISIRGRTRPRPPGLSGVEEVVFGALAERPVHVDEICAGTQLEIAQVSYGLSKLALMGYAMEEGNTWFVNFE